MSPSEITGLVVGVLTCMALLIGALGWFIKAKIREFTQPIQPNSNGGRSLADLHLKVDALAVDMTLLKKAVLDIEDELEDMR